MSKVPDIQHLVRLAKQAITHSYSPYSGFPVAAVVVGAHGDCFTGVNVENSSYGITCCAERTAIFSAVSAGVRSFEYLLIYTPTEQPVTPCGACRQVIREFSESVTIHSVCDSDESLVTDIAQLLPNAFEFAPYSDPLPNQRNDD